MTPEELSYGYLFSVLLEQGSFTRAAIVLGMTQSALSQRIRQFEARLGVRLVNRTTRSLAATEAGEKFLSVLRPALSQMGEAFETLSDFRDKPGGRIRLSADDFAISHILWPVLRKFMARYPEIQFEISSDYALGDIVGKHYDVGIRRAGLVARDMVAFPLCGDIEMVVIGSPPYFSDHPAPRTPRALSGHDCLNLRLPAHGALFEWRFLEEGRMLHVPTESRLIFNRLDYLVQAAREGLGLAWVPRLLVKNALEEGTLLEVLAPWRYHFEGYQLYYPNRRHHSRSMALFIGHMRHYSHKLP